MMKDLLERWTIQDSEDVYGIRNWGAGYFGISENGHVVVMPMRENPSVQVSIADIISEIRDRGLDMPVLLRIENILDSQIQKINEDFQSAFDLFGYKGAYRGVYPIKVNQQQQVVKEVARFGARYHYGLEAGSKAELIAALSFMKDPEACLICNGYKDEEFVDLGLYACKMGIRCFFVIEMPSELDLLVARAKELDVRPLIGVRIKISARAGGHWSESGGDRSIFGLNTTQLINLVDRLKKEKMLDCLRLVHYHLGSQIPNIRDIRSAVLEACRVYAGLVDEGAPMGYLDLGGGLAVDYDGTHTNFMNSRNYTLKEYCVDVVETIVQVLDERNIAHPNIITEAGRAVVAYYSILLFNVLDVCRFAPKPLPEKLPADTPELVINLMETFQSLTLRNLQECFNDAIYYRDEIREKFRHGDIALRERSLADTIFWHIIQRIQQQTRRLKRVPQDLTDVRVALADIYYCNFSLFQSLPDAWALDQIFPVMPVHRLAEMPAREGIIADITCDSDGKIDRFLDPQGVRHVLPLHAMKPNEEYYMGVFLVGAYQETLGDLHNLLGDTNVVSIRVSRDGSYRFDREIKGDSVADLLTYVQYNPEAMMDRFRKTAEKAVRIGKITAQDRRAIMNAYESGLRGYTYFER